MIGPGRRPSRLRACSAEHLRVTVERRNRAMNTMAAHFRKAMDALYFICVVIAGMALVLISAIIPWGVYTRYVLNSAASWPEPAAVLLTIWLTFFGAAACYRLRFHMNVSFFVMLMPVTVQRAFNLLAELLMIAMALFMTVYGLKLVDATWL